MNAGDVVEARMTPQRVDDLAPGAEILLGEVWRWTATWILDEGPYEGQWRMTLDRAVFERTRIRWAPECDLSEISWIGVDDDYV